MSYTNLNHTLSILILLFLVSPAHGVALPDFTETNKSNAYKYVASPWNYSSFDESIFHALENDTTYQIPQNFTIPAVDTSLSQDLPESALQDVSSTQDSDTVQTTTNSDPTNIGETEELSTGPEESIEDDSATGPRIPHITDIISFTKILIALIVILIVWVVTRFVSSVLTNMSERFQNHRLIIKRIIPVFKVLSWSLGLYFVIAGVLQPPLETIITVSASIGIAVGFASHDILRNIFGGIMIILDRPFQVGDKIQVDSNYGEVLEIGLRSVRIVTEDDSVVTIPNSEIMNKAVSNSNSSALDCQVVAELFLPSGIDIDAAVQICRKAAMTSRYVYLNKPIFVHSTHHTIGPRDFIKLRLKAYVLDIRFEQELRSDMTALAMGELKKRGVIS